MNIIRCFFCRKRGPLEFAYAEDCNGKTVSVCMACEERFADAGLCFHVLPVIRPNDVITIKLSNVGKQSSPLESLYKMGLRYESPPKSMADTLREIFGKKDKPN